MKRESKCAHKAFQSIKCAAHLFCLLMAICVLGDQTLYAAEPTIGEIQAAIQARLGASQNYIVNWEATWVEPKGSKTPILISLKDEGALRGELDPPQDGMLHSTGQIMAFGPWKRVSCTQDKFDFDRVLQRDWEDIVCVMNGRRQATWWSRPPSSADPLNTGRAIITERMPYGIAVFDEQCSDTFEAPRIAPAFSVNVVQPEMVVLRQEEAEGVLLTVVGNPPESWTAARESRYEFFLDPAHGYALVRYRTMMANGLPTSEVSYTYVQSSEFGWIPVRAEVLLWTGKNNLTRMGDLNLAVQSLNTTFDPTLFEIQFPLGTQVVDETKDIQYTVESPAQGDAWAEEILGSK